MTPIPASVRELIVVAVVATLLTLGPSAMAAQPTPVLASVASPTAKMCPADHVIPTADAKSEARPAATAAHTPEPTPETAAFPSPGPGLKVPPPAPLTNLGGSWSKLPRSPFAAVTAVAVWAGDRMVAIDPASGRTATYDPSTRRWEEHQPIPGGSRALDGIPNAVWTGDEVVIAGHRNTPDGATPVPLAFDPGTGRWRTLATSPLDHTGELAWVGDLLIEVTAGRHAAAYDPSDDCWIAMPDIPLPDLPANDRTMRAMDWSPSQLVWVGDRLLAIVQTEDPEFGLGVVAFDPQTWTWDPGPQGPLSSQVATAILIDGQLLFMDRSPNDRWLANGKRLDPDATLWAAGVDLSAGGLSFVYDRDDVQRMRVRKKDLEKRLGVPVSISSGRVRDL